MWKRLLFWEYSRVTWQYNVLCGAILVFIFATPRAWFRDQPRIPTANSIALLPSEKQSSIFFVNPELLAGVPENEWTAKATHILQVRMKDTRLFVTRVEPVLDSEGELQGYMAFARS